MNDMETLCRFCLTSSPPLLQPCLCSGTSAHVHFQCLSKWISNSKCDHCSICLHKFEGITIRRIGKSFFSWFRHTNEASFIICFIYGFFFTMYILYLGVFDYLVSDGLIGDNYRLALIIPAIIFGLTFVGLTCVACIHTYHSFRNWQNDNYQLRVTVSNKLIV